MVLFVEDRSSTTQFELAEMYDHGERLSRNYQEAFKWYLASAKRGYRRAQHRLGSMYARGQGVACNYIKAYAWCEISAQQKSRRASLKLREIERYMSERQISDARKLAQQYYSIYVEPYLVPAPRLLK
jgi:TPR repeat protein